MAGVRVRGCGPYGRLITVRGWLAIGGGLLAAWSPREPSVKPDRDRRHAPSRGCAHRRT